jgi:hypothetical protein
MYRRWRPDSSQSIRILGRVTPRFNRTVAIEGVAQYPAAARTRSSALVAEAFPFRVAMTAIGAFLPKQARPSSRRWSVRQRHAIVPGHPAGGIRRQFCCVPLQLDQVLERVGLA